MTQPNHPNEEPSGDGLPPNPDKVSGVPAPLPPPPPPPKLSELTSLHASDLGSDAFAVEGPVLTEDDLQSPRSRRVRLPLMLFLITCVSCFYVAVMDYSPDPFGSVDFRQAIIRNWQQGLIYTGCVLAILGAHEMGHFLMTLRYRIPASFPFFIPMPFNPLGTLGAVISMDGMRADRKQMFDIGLAGPLAGLVVAAPLLWIGVGQLDLRVQSSGDALGFDLPWAAQLVMAYRGTPGYVPGAVVSNVQANPYFMAGWVGMLITGLNMFPVSQLDGGHVSYAVFGVRAHLVARAFIFIAIGFVVFFGGAIWTLMLVLIILIGTDHPPTADDRMQLGGFRTALGAASLLIPLFCFPPKGVIPFGF